MVVGKTIRKKRKELGWTQAKLAQRMNVSYQAVSKWENGQSMPDAALLPELAAVLGITLDELMGGEPGEEKPRAYYGNIFGVANQDIHADVGRIFGVVNGDIYGSVKGGVIGRAKNIYGNVEGSVWGVIDGDVTGYIGKNVYGTITGSARGGVRGKIFGRIIGGGINQKEKQK